MGNFIVNPTYDEQREGNLNLMVVGTADGIVMIESGAQGGFRRERRAGHRLRPQQIKKIALPSATWLSRWAEPSVRSSRVIVDEAYLGSSDPRLAQALPTRQYGEASQERKLHAHQQIEDDFKRRFRKRMKPAARNFHLLRSSARADFPRTGNHSKRRPDGRKFDQIREIWIEVGVLPRTHGSSIFTRGETQALVTTTLGTGDDMQRLEAFQGEAKKHFMLHYNFPPFSVGEVAFLRGAGRREIGHGALAERLSAVLPSETDWPYAMRVVSDILESNGSSSMATVCGASLSMMDAGVPLKAPVAGVAMGLVKEGDEYAILTDIAGAEDHYGDMDFKVAGTRDGITALQMDIKVWASLRRSCGKRWTRRARPLVHPRQDE